MQVAPVTPDDDLPELVGGAFGPIGELADVAADIAGADRGRITLLLPGGVGSAVVGADVPGLPTPVRDDAVVAPDAASHPRLAALPAVRRGDVVAYVGLPVRDTRGQVIGALEAVATRPLTLTPDVVERLEKVATAVAAQLEIATQFGDLVSDQKRWQLAVEAGGVGSFDWDLLTDRLDWDDQLRALFGYRADDFVPHIASFRDRLHPEDLAATEAIIAEAIAVSGRFRADYRIVRPDGTVRWVQARGQVTRDPDGHPVRMLGVAYDVTEAHQVRSLARRTRDRLSLLAAVADVLAGAGDVDDTVGRIATVLVPRLADFCIMSVLGDDGRLHDVGWQHADAAMLPVLRRYSAHRLQQVSDRSWGPKAVATGRITVVPFPAHEHIAPMLGDPVAVEALADLAPAFAVCVPLRARDQVVGLITLANTIETGPFSSNDQQIAAEVASRIGGAVDAARSFQRQRRIAEALQRSLLTAPPVAAPWEIAVRYEASVDDVQVGGDWYDAFGLADGSLVVTVGDVMGHDSVAAARMGQLRSMLRGIFFASSPGPAHALAVVDDAMARIGMPGSATVVVARLHPAPDGGAEVTWSTAGHPPPAVVGPGRAWLVTAPVDPPLGVRAGLTRRDHAFRLAADETLLCYTDGLVERRDEDIDVGLARLLAAARVAGADPTVLCDRVLTDLAHDDVTGRGGDDIVTLAVRCQPSV